MKKVPHWLKKVIFVSQKIWCADTRNMILDELISGEFDKIKFDKFCHNTYNIKVNDNPNIAHNYYEALELCDKNFEPISMQQLINNEGL